ncbi:MAG TPA: hypothetical protein PLD20_13265 [Blastocatellia bacterium]|nr:hypothetical protein [Blastocatellia bacterium]HMV81661.1 hypothetical protein [Blastocatellia bacterium]HMX29685.1 hypothetical protein [Blastocatellia bacterium]HMZ18899.1 hypothetical protein [Blastocatellia bacterium]HNG32145.1 hypothetical protein [Blastocatellia bacterium]
MKLIVRLNLTFLTLVLIAFSALAQTAKPAEKPPEKPLDKKAGLTAAEFSKLSRDLSEEGGYFRSENFTSNETPYLHVVDKLKELGATGGAYLGVGPEQNYTYIAKIRPQIAFLLDIRRQAIIQHLMYKAVFHHSPTRAQFLAMLFSRPLAKDKTFAADAPIADLVAYFSSAAADEKTYAANLALIRKTIQEDFQFPLSEADQKSLEHVYQTFRDEGLDISYQVGQFRGGNFPVLKDLILQTDLNGKLGNYLARVEDFEFMRGMHEKNLIIPVVGNFAGRTAIAAVGDYLKKNGLTVTAFYLSNVEQYLFMDQLFADFANNVKKLPITDKSLMIRSASGRGASHPARQAGHRSATLLMKISVFIKDFDEEKFKTYNDLLLTDYIAAEKPEVK